MAATLYLHIGLPKTGTTYLQQVLWSHRDALAADGLLLPGGGHREHLWAALAAQGRPGLQRRHVDAPQAWNRLRAEIAAWNGDALVTHEFFCAAGPDDVARIVAEVAPAQVHVVVTARHALAMLSAGWHELVKNGGTLTPEEAATRAGRSSEFSWRTWDLRGVLRRWSSAIPPERIHVLALPGPGDPPERHWENFASVVGITTPVVLPERAANQSLGVVQVEALRRINRGLDDFHSPHDRGVWIRGQLAERWLQQQTGESFSLAEDLVEECRRRSRKAVSLVRKGGFAMVGDLDSLLVPADLPARRTPADVTPDELVEAMSGLVAVMLAEVREGSRRSVAVSPTA